MHWFARRSCPYVITLLSLLFVTGTVRILLLQCRYCPYLITLPQLLSIPDYFVAKVHLHRQKPRALQNGVGWSTEVEAPACLVCRAEQYGLGLHVLRPGLPASPVTVDLDGVSSIGS